MTTRRFPASVVNEARRVKYFGIRVGAAPHRWIGIWMVEVEGRLFARSWTMRKDGWHRRSLEDPVAVIRVGSRELRASTRPVRSERIKNAVTDAYFAKYDTPASLKYCRGFARGKRRETTTELVPR